MHSFQSAQALAEYYKQAPIRIGVIGGSGLYNMDALADIEEVNVKTPFGSPSDALIVGKLDGVPVAFLALTVATIRLPPQSYRLEPTSTP